MDTVTFNMNGKSLTVPLGTTLLKAADSFGIEIPRLCNHPSLAPSGACRVCIVEDIKRGRIVASCTTPVEDGMVIETASERVLNHRRNILRLMMAEHPESCLVCGKGNRCELRHVAAKLNVGGIDLAPMPHVRRMEKVNPFIERDLSKCILCGRCIRACTDLVGVGAIDFNDRGFASRPATLHDGPLSGSSCIFCGSCLSICPTGALLPTGGMFLGTPEKDSPSVCGFCGVGCHISVGTSRGVLVEVNPSHEGDSVNGSTLCVRGHFAHDYINSDKRLDAPMIRKDGVLTRVSWQEAMDFTCRRLAEVRDTYGPGCMGFYGSSKCTSEENYLFKKLATCVIKTANTDSGAAVYGETALKRYLDRSGGWGPAGGLSTIAHAGVILILGTEMEKSSPVVEFHVRRAAEKGIPVIRFGYEDTIAASRKTDNVVIVPGSELELIAAVSALMLEGDKCIPDTATQSTGFNSFRQGLSSLSTETVSRQTGVSVEKIKEISRTLIKSGKITCIAGDNVLRQNRGGDVLDAIFNLSALSGNPGGVLLALPENNIAGSVLMGTVPGMLPGNICADLTGTRLWEKLWNENLPQDPGLSIFRMLDEAMRGNMKSMYIMGENPVRSLAGRDSKDIKEAISKLEFLVVQDILDTETVKLAHVVLPGATSLEKSGSFINMEGAVQHFKEAVNPPGLARPDIRIIGDVMAGILGEPQPKDALADVCLELTRSIPFYSSGTASIVVGEAAFEFSSPVFQEEVLLVEEEFTAVAMPSRYHLGMGTRTELSPRISSLSLSCHMKLSPADGDRLGIMTGDNVKVWSEFGEVTGKTFLSRDVPEGVVLIPWAENSNRAMELFGLPVEVHGFTRPQLTLPVNISKI